MAPKKNSGKEKGKKELEKLPKRRWKPEEIKFLTDLYTADPDMRPGPVADAFHAVFGGERLRDHQCRYVRLRYIYPDGQADNPKYANRHRGPRTKTKDAAA